MFRPKTLLFLLYSLVFFFFNGTSFPSEEWKNYTSNRMDWCLAIEGNYLWQGTMGGAVRRNISNPLADVVYFTKANSGLPHNFILSIAIDKSGNKWFGTDGYGVAKFDGANWTTYNTSNSGLANNYVQAMAADSTGSVWLGTDGGGVSKFDGASWTTYNSSNSGLVANWVYSIAIDDSGSIWFATCNGGG